VICTSGGPTDEFTSESLVYRIRSSPKQRRFSTNELGDYLEPDLDHLVELMRHTLRERNEASRKADAGALDVARNFTWARVTERLLDVLNQPATA
jgi:hypothetical protein